jgi:hypothetical protein
MEIRSCRPTNRVQKTKGLSPRVVDMLDDKVDVCGPLSLLLTSPSSC